jgi:hypothetical protein
MSALKLYVEYERQKANEDNQSANPLLSGNIIAAPVPIAIRP